MNEPQIHWFDEALKIFGWILLASVIFSLMTGSPEGMALGGVVVFVFGFNWLLGTLVKVGEGIAHAGRATLDAVSQIRITFPKRAPTKKEIGDWFLADHHENNEILDAAPLHDHERAAARERNQANLMHNIDSLFGTRRS